MLINRRFGRVLTKTKTRQSYLYNRFNAFEIHKYRRLPMSSTVKNVSTNGCQEFGDLETSLENLIPTIDNIHLLYENIKERSNQGTIQDTMVTNVIKQYENIIETRVRFSPHKESLLLQYLDLISIHMNKQLYYIDKEDLNTRLIEQGLASYKHLNFIAKNISQLLNKKSIQQIIIYKLELFRDIILKKKKLSQLGIAENRPEYFILFNLDFRLTIQLLSALVNISIYNFVDTDNALLATQQYFQEIEALLKHLLDRIVVEQIDIAQKVR